MRTIQAFRFWYGIVVMSTIAGLILSASVIFGGVFLWTFAVSAIAQPLSVVFFSE